MTPEAKTKKRVKKIFDDAGAYYFMPPANGYGRAGIPDFIACLKGHFIAVECKSASGEPTALQLRELQKITGAGGIAMVVHDRESDYRELETVLENINYG